MARIAGRSGRFYVGIASDTASAEPLAYVSKMTIDFSTDNFDVTALGDTNKQYVSGLPDCQGTFSGFFDDSTAQTYTAATDGLPRRFYWYPKTPSTAGPYWFGTMLPDFSADADVNGPTAISGSWNAASNVFKVG